MHTTQYSSTLAAYDGLVMAFLSGGVLDFLFLPSGLHSPPQLACISKNSNKSLKSGTVLEL